MRLILKVLLKARPHKYIKKWRGRGGEWVYLYPKTGDPRKYQQMLFPEVGPGKKERHLPPEEEPPMDIEDVLDLAEAIDKKYDTQLDAESFISWASRHFNNMNIKQALDSIEEFIDDYGPEDMGRVIETAVFREKDIESAHYYVTGWDYIYSIARAGQDAASDYGMSELGEVYPEDIDAWADIMEGSGYGIENFQDDGDFSRFDPDQSQLDPQWTYDMMVYYAVKNNMTLSQVKEYVEELNQDLRDIREEDEGKPSYGLEYDESKAKYYNLDPDTATSAMTTGHVFGASSLGGGVNTTIRIQIENGEYLEAVFKPRSGETKFDIHTDTVPRGTQYIREVAAYEIDHLIGAGVVPPTVKMEIEGDIGSAQYFVPEAETAYERSVAWEYDVPDAQVASAAMIDYLIKNLDRHQNNFMIDVNDNLYLIDNGYSFPTKHTVTNRIPFAIAVRSRKDLSLEENIMRKVPYKQALKIRDVTEGEIRSVLENVGIEGSAIDLFVDRWDRLREAVSAIEAEGGKIKKPKPVKPPKMSEMTPVEEVDTDLIAQMPEPPVGIVTPHMQKENMIRDEMWRLKQNG